VATLNEYAYDQDPEKIGDTRWLHRGRFDWDWAEQRHDPESIPGRVFNGLLRLIQLRNQNLAFSRADTEFVDTGNPHVFGYFRTHDEHSVLVLANFSEQGQEIEGRHLRLLGLRKTVIDMYSGHYLTAALHLSMEPYQFMVLARTAL
jgi:amylosucrase/maltose alpha-D-glucosyltransferase/alpha-amylase